MKIIKKVLIGIVILVIIANLGLYFWSESGYKAMKITENYLKSNGSVEVTDESDWITFYPKDNQKGVGIIFYPGGNVEAESYSPLAFRLAEEGMSVFILRVPYKLAILNPYKAKNIIDRENLSKYYIGGHSLGGVVSSMYYDKYPEKIEGLFFLASYPIKDLSDEEISTLSIQGTKDGLMPIKEFKEKRKLFPKNSNFIQITGGNHSQFGYYGMQDKDKITDLSREKQQDIIYKAVLEFISK